MVTVTEAVSGRMVVVVVERQQGYGARAAKVMTVVSSGAVVMKKRIENVGGT